LALPISARLFLASLLWDWWGYFGGEEEKKKRGWEGQKREKGTYTYPFFLFSLFFSLSGQVFLRGGY
jgi:hypothetical protein